MNKAIINLMIIAASHLIVACSTNTPEVRGDGGGSLPEPITAKPCGVSMLFDMTDNVGISNGYLEVFNDSSELIIIFKPLAGSSISGSSIAYFPEAGGEMAMPSLAPFQDGSWGLRAPVQPLQACGHIRVAVKVLRPDKSNGAELLPSGGRDLDEDRRIRYCKHRCGQVEDCFGKSIAAQYRCYSEGRWFKEGDSVHMYLDREFEKRFPNGLEMGCETKRRLETAPKLMSWLDTYKSPASLALAREVAALELNIRFDEADTSFAPSNSPFSRLVVASGNFGGWTTLGLLEEGHAVLGDCPSNYSAQQMTAVIRSVNESLAVQGESTGFLICE